MSSGLVIVAGSGAGLGQALLRRFAAGGYTAVGLVRTLPEVIPAGFELVAADLADRVAVQSALRAVIDRHGPPRIVIHNAAELVIRPFLELADQDFERCWRSMVLSAVHLGQMTIGPMVGAGGGAFIVSGATASLRGGAKFAAFASAKFALRGLTQSLAREFQSSGVHVAHVVIDGILDTERSRALHTFDPSLMLKTKDVADTYWGLAHQPRSAWTHELDIRPMTERF
jgi:NAD(P)-dependent dehydrogenase (short-subunit alcohol dehydrogenase family)